MAGIQRILRPISSAASRAATNSAQAAISVVRAAATHRWRTAAAIALGWLSAVAAPSANAAAITFRLEGVVDQTSDLIGALGDETQLRTMTGRYTIDTDASGQIYDPSERFITFDNHAPPAYVEMNVGPLHFHTSPDLVRVLMFQRDEQQLGSADEYGFFSEFNDHSGLTTPYDVDRLELSMQLATRFDNPIMSLEQPRTPPDLSLFTQRDFLIDGECTRCPFEATFQIRGTITSLTLDSESAAPGDLNNDGLVNRIDAAILATAFGKPANDSASAADLNGDGAVNLRDLAMLQAHLSAASAPNVTSMAVPEPCTSAMAAGAALGLFGSAIQTIKKRRRGRFALLR
jgi:hypothetical protein